MKHRTWVVTGIWNIAKYAIVAFCGCCKKNATVQKAENPLSLTKINLHQRFATVPTFFLQVAAEIKPRFAVVGGLTNWLSILWVFLCIKPALVDEDHLLGLFCLTSILSVASRNLVTAFRRIKVVNKLAYSVICSLIPQYYTSILHTSLAQNKGCLWCAGI